MNYKQENKLNMYLVVKTYLMGVPASILLLMPNFNEYFDAFQASLELIRVNNEGQRRDRKGFRITKDEYKLLMIQLAVNIAARIKAFAVAENNLVLANEMHFKKSYLINMRDTVSADLCHSVYLKGTELLNELTSYGVTDDTLKDLNNSIIAFNEYIPLPRNGIIVRKNLTSIIQILFDQCDDKLSNIDNLVNMLEDGEESFYREYKNSRKLVNNRGSKLALRGVVKDVSGLALQKATVSIESLGLTAKTSIKGNYEFKHLSSGVYNVTFTKPGFSTLVLPVAITKTVRVNLDAVLQNNELVKKTA